MGKFDNYQQEGAYQVPPPPEQKIPEPLCPDPAGIANVIQDLRTGQEADNEKFTRVNFPEEENCNETEGKQEDKIILAADQQAALDEIINGEWQLFHLTGQAGSGKSFLINYLRNNYRCATTATTAVAAQLIKGTTVHRLTKYWDGAYNKNPSFNASKLMEALAGYDYWIIDEISMMSKRMFETLYEGMKLVMGRGVKIIMVGDFLQLPPVPSRSRDPINKKWLTAFDSDKYAFTSPHWAVPNYDLGIWQHTNVYGINLMNQHRQDDLTFIYALNHLRRGAMTEELRQIIFDHSSYNLPEDCTILAPRKKEVQAINNERLAKIDEKKYTFTAAIDPQPALSRAEGVKPAQDEIDKCTKMARFPIELEVKIGARVMMLKNNELGGYINGTSGEVVDIDKDKSIITVRTDDKRIIEVGPEEEVIYDYNGKPLLNIIQYPMMLAFSVTIHKSQGCTIDRAGIILDRHFAAGQTYVAMSRLKSSEGLFCKGYIEKIITDPSALLYLKGNGWLD